MEKIEFTFSETDETVDFFVLEQTMINELTYLLVTEQEEGDGDAYILKELSEEDTGMVVYEMVEEEEELESVAKIFEQLLEDVEFER